MPRKVTTRTGGRDSVESSVQAPGLVAVARPSAAPLPRNSYRPEVSPGMVATTAALGKLTGIFAGMSREQLQNQAEFDHRAGQRQRLDATQSDLDNIDTILEGHSDERRQGFMYQHGKSNAIKAGAELKQLYERDKGSLVTPGQTSKWLAKHMAGMLQGASEDGDYTQGFLQSFAGVEEQIRNKNAEDNFLVSRAQSRDDYSVAYRGDLQQVSDAGGSLEQLHDTTRAYMAHAKTVGLDREFAMEVAFENYRQLAEDAGRFDIFGVGTDGSGVFDLESVDVDDPDRIIPGSASSIKWMKRISDEKLRLESVQGRNTTKRDQWGKYQLSRAVDDQMKLNNWEPAKAMYEEGIRKGTFSAGEGMTLGNKIDKHRADYMSNLRRERAIEGNVAHMAYAAGETRGDMQQTFDTMFANDWDMAAGDPIKMDEAIQDVVLKGVNSGLKPTMLATLFEGATPGNGPKFVHAMNIYGNVKRIDPQYAASMLNDRDYTRVAMYEAMLEGGDSAAEALEALAQLNTPEAQKEANQVFGRNQYKRIEEIRELIPDAYSRWTEFDMDAANETYVEQRVLRDAKVLLATSGGLLTAKQATTQSMKRFLNTNTAVPMPKEIDGTKKAMFVYNNGIPLPEDFGPAQEHFSKLVHPKLEGTRYQDSHGYFLSADPTDKDKQRYIVHRASTGRAVPNLTVNFGELMDNFRSRDVKSPETLKAEHTEAQVEHQATQERAERGTKRVRKARKAGPSAL